MKLEIIIVTSTKNQDELNLKFLDELWLNKNFILSIMSRNTVFQQNIKYNFEIKRYTEIELSDFIDVEKYLSLKDDDIENLFRQFLKKSNISYTKDKVKIMTVRSNLHKNMSGGYLYVKKCLKLSFVFINSIKN